MSMLRVGLKQNKDVGLAATAKTDRGNVFRSAVGETTAVWAELCKCEQQVRHLLSEGKQSSRNPLFPETQSGLPWSMEIRSEQRKKL